MSEAIIGFFGNIISNDYLLLFILSLVPLVEMRGAVILASGMAVDPWLAMLVCGAGSACLAFPLLFGLKPIFNWLKKFKFFHKIILAIESVFIDKADGVKATASKRYNNKVYLALSGFVAVPLPLTGVWTGSGIAAFMDLKTPKAGVFIITANFIACFLLTVLMQFAGEYVDIVLIVFGILILFSVVTLAAKAIQHMRKASALEEKTKDITNTPNDKSKK